MEARLKAEELVLKFRELPQEGTVMFYLSFEVSKQCSLIAVDEILNALEYLDDDSEYFWEQVKQEIEKL